MGIVYKKYKKITWILILFLLYFLLKLTINSEPLISISNGRLNIGLINFYKKPVAAEVEYQFAIRPFMTISPYETDLTSKHPQLPLSGRDPKGNLHIMGTDRLGRDVLAGFVSGLELALIISLSVGLFTGIITMLLGAIGAYFGRYPKKTTRLRMLVLLICLLKLILITSWYFLGIYSGMALLCFTFILMLVIFVIIKLPIKAGHKLINLPIQSINRRFLEFFQPIPDLIFLMLFALLFDQMNIYGLILLLILLRIPFGAYYLQGLANQYVHQPHIDQAKSMGLSSFRIITRHLMPLMIPGTTVFMVLSASRAVLSESALAFLGIGPTGNYITWGTMIKLGLTNLNMWWVSFFPIVGLVCLSMLYQRLGKSL